MKREDSIRVKAKERARDETIESSDWTTFFRALATNECDELVRNLDYLAKHFLVQNWMKYHLIILKRIRLLNFLLWYIARYGLGGYCFVNARTKHIDATLTEALNSGIEQFVILAAGNDSRPYRFREELSGIRIFELDFPGTQNQKKDMLSKLFGSLPEHVTYVPIDFNSQSLKEILEAEGYDSGKKTFFIWEGCANYLPETVVNSVLEFVAKNSPAGSSIVFDYVTRSFVERDYSAYGAKRYAKAFKRMGEPCLSGIEDGEIETYLKERGLRVVSNFGPEDLENKYLRKQSGKLQGRIPGFFRVAYAEVPV